MTALEQIQINPNYFTLTTIKLCVISYFDAHRIPEAVASDCGLRVVWGPAQLAHWDGIPYSLMFIAEKADSGELFVVIRGTNFESLSAWRSEDFAVGNSQPFAALPGNPPKVPTDALISQATFNGMTDLLNLRDPQTGRSAVEFLQASLAEYIYVTGHSLGGTLTPTMGAYLNAMIYDGQSNSDIAMWSYAGLTPGGNGFNQYFNQMLPNVLLRYHNTLDIAPYCWYAKDGIRDIYKPHKLAWSWAEEKLVDSLFTEAAHSGIGYAQPVAGIGLEGVFDSSIIEDYSWFAQALHQHHVSTYRYLIERTVFG
ncbi:MAG: hypothetical protein OEZ39_00855 [Gammaproteobacteria bacterium]|nr:hypothetical protein [Gammaproteobacteria bacterium]MDH5650399.1 hypothetical protein [Gammaproteobacteria bacterium]